MTTGRGQIVCVDATSGQRRLDRRRGPRCYASLVASGRRVYALGRDGTMQIVAAERSYRVLGTCSLGEGSDATPALGNGRIVHPRPQPLMVPRRQRRNCVKLTHRHKPANEP